MTEYTEGFARSTLTSKIDDNTIHDVIRWAASRGTIMGGVAAEVLRRDITITASMLEQIWRDYTGYAAPMPVQILDEDETADRIAYLHRKFYKP